MATLLTKKLRNLQIGTIVNLSYQNSAEKKWTTGMVTDNDFESGLEFQAGEELLLLDYTLICGLQIQRTIQQSLRDLEVNTSIRYTLDELRELDQTGCVVWNNHENAIGLKKPGCPTQTILYAQFTGLGFCEGTADPYREATAKYCRDPKDMLRASDTVIQKTYAEMPRNEQKLFSGINQRFVYGIKNNDRQKQEDAANQARQVIFRQEEQGYNWSPEAALYVSYLLHRSGNADSEVLLSGEVLPEAAYAAWCEEEYVRAGAYAVAALLEDEPREAENLLRILAGSILKSGDASGLLVLRRHLPAPFALQTRELMAELMSTRGGRQTEDADRDMDWIMESFPGTEMERIATSWLPRELTQVPEAKKPEVPAEAVRQCIGQVSKLNWSDGTALIDCTDGQKYTFPCDAVADRQMQDHLRSCMRSDLDGKVYFVTFDAREDLTARNVRPFTDYVDKARNMTTTRDEMRFELAYAMCKEALDTWDRSRAIADLVRYAVALGSAKHKTEYVEDALALYETHAEAFPASPFALMDVVRCWSCLKNHPRALEYAEKVMDFTGVQARQKIVLLSHYLKIARICCNADPSSGLLVRMKRRIDQTALEIQSERAADPGIDTLFQNSTVGYRVMIACDRDDLEEAKDLFSGMSANHTMYGYVKMLIAKTETRLTEAMAVSLPCEETPEEPQPAAAETEIPEAVLCRNEADAPREESPAQCKPYTDVRGWNDLGLSKEDAVDYALRIRGDGRTAALLTWLHAAANLNEQLRPLCRTVALAANDPMEPVDHSPEAVINALAEVDSAYPRLGALCMDAAYLRAFFLCGRAYCSQMLRSSFASDRQPEALRDLCDTLEEFRREAGCSVDVYADYHSHDVRKRKAERAGVIRCAGELYEKFVQNPPRDGARFLRLLKTKQVVFDKNGYLASMLRRIMEQDRPALNGERDHFLTTFLKEDSPLSRTSINGDAIEAVINTAWELAGKNLTMEKGNATLQGDRRNNIRSNISEVLHCVIRWYALDEQEAGALQRTEAGETAYQRLRPKLLEQLTRLEQDCSAGSEDPQTDTGLHLLGCTARELRGRLDGSWSQEHRTWMYADLLRGSGILLTDDGMPDLSATFCDLEDFNILARIRGHVEQPKRTWQQQVDLIFGPDAACGNYGAARQIAEYLLFTGEYDSVTFPEHPERYEEYAKMQAQLRFNRFLETCGLARINGLINDRDPSWHTLEDTLRYWHHVCGETGNYGFFISLLAAQERRLDDQASRLADAHMQQLQELMQRCASWFAEHPGHAEAVRQMIAAHHFAVARDWMRRISEGTFTLELSRPEALQWLEQFFSDEYIDTYRKVADTSRSLQSLLESCDGWDQASEPARQLASAWICGAQTADAARMEQLLNLLGWNGVRAERVCHPDDRELELYRITAGEDFSPRHPIPAFGSGLTDKPMYAACLYGVSDCDRIADTAALLDRIEGSKVILLDCALSQSERRTLANRMKQRRTGLHHPAMIIDRVLIAHLTARYDADTIARMLTACAMPFSFCAAQADSGAPAPELFAGRREALRQIIAHDGAELLISGAGLGKTTLIRHAAAMLDGHEGRRAAVVDVDGLDCGDAAREVFRELVRLEILEDADATADWQSLCSRLRSRLDREDGLSSLLLFLDNADAMVRSSDASGAAPLELLAALRQALAGKFKAVLTGKGGLADYARRSAETGSPAKVLVLGPMDDEEAQELLTAHLSWLGVTFPDRGVLSQVLTQCAGYPGLLRMYADKLADTLREPDYAGYDLKNTPCYGVSSEHLRRIAGDASFQERLRAQLAAALAASMEGRSGTLALLLGWLQHAAPAPDGYTAQQILQYAGELSLTALQELTAAQLGAMLTELTELNLLRPCADGKYLPADDRYADLLGTEETIFEELMNIGGVQE